REGGAGARAQARQRRLRREGARRRRRGGPRPPRRGEDARRAAARRREGAVMTPDLRIDPARAALLVVDVQERLFAAMDPTERARVQRTLLVLVELARRLAIPVVSSEQYPKGLGPTLPELVQALDAPELAVHRFEKLEFSCVAAPGFAPIR